MPLAGACARLGHAQLYRVTSSWCPYGAAMAHGDVNGGSAATTTVGAKGQRGRIDFPCGRSDAA
uniref:Uncharacterized protein n=1 Tax=Arundo donax TaxID=35708 RepID=A0A0A9AT12_ARUDO